LTLGKVGLSKSSLGIDSLGKLSLGVSVSGSAERTTLSMCSGTGGSSLTTVAEESRLRATPESIPKLSLGIVSLDKVSLGCSPPVLG
jgi:hypothetical protein